MPLNETQMAAFWRNVKRPRDPDKCWKWLGAKKGAGYARFCHGKMDTSARRVSLEIFTGEPVERDLDVYATCGNRACTNPRHLRAMTKDEWNEWEAERQYQKMLREEERRLARQATRTQSETSTGSDETALIGSASGSSQPS